MKKVKYLRRKNVCCQENYGDGMFLGEKVKYLRQFVGKK